MWRLFVLSFIPKIYDPTRRRNTQRRLLIAINIVVLALLASVVWVSASEQGKQSRVGADEATCLLSAYATKRIHYPMA